MQYIDFSVNNIKHVGHDIILSGSCAIRFLRNPCIDAIASTPAERDNYKTIIKLSADVFSSNRLYTNRFSTNRLLTKKF